MLSANVGPGFREEDVATSGLTLNGGCPIPVRGSDPSGGTRRPTSSLARCGLSGTNAEAPSASPDSQGVGEHLPRPEVVDSGHAPLQPACLETGSCQGVAA